MRRRQQEAGTITACFHSLRPAGVTIRRRGEAANVGIHLPGAVREEEIRAMASVIMVYSTTDGHTVKICERLREVIEQHGHEVTVTELQPGGIDLAPYDRIVIGASIRYGKHRPEVAEFIEQNLDSLQSKPSAFFSVNAVARKPEKRDPDTNPYVRKFLQSISWQPPVIGVFGGKIDYPKYGFVDKTMIRFIMWMTKGPTDPNSVTEFTDWDAVDALGRRIGADWPA